MSVCELSIRRNLPNSNTRSYKSRTELVPLMMAWLPTCGMCHANHTPLTADEVAVHWMNYSQQIPITPQQCQRLAALFPSITLGVLEPPHIKKLLAELQEVLSIKKYKDACQRFVCAFLPPLFKELWQKQQSATTVVEGRAARSNTVSMPLLAEMLVRMGSSQTGPYCLEHLQKLQELMGPTQFERFCYVLFTLEHGQKSLVPPTSPHTTELDLDEMGRPYGAAYCAFKLCLPPGYQTQTVTISPGSSPSGGTRLDDQVGPALQARQDRLRILQTEYEVCELNQRDRTIQLAAANSQLLNAQRLQQSLKQEYEAKLKAVQGELVVHQNSLKTLESEVESGKQVLSAKYDAVTDVKMEIYRIMRAVCDLTQVVGGKRRRADDNDGSCNNHETTGATDDEPDDMVGQRIKQYRAWMKEQESLMQPSHLGAPHTLATSVPHTYPLQYEWCYDEANNAAAPQWKPFPYFYCHMILEAALHASTHPTPTWSTGYDTTSTPCLYLCTGSHSNAIVPYRCDVTAFKQTNELSGVSRGLHRRPIGTHPPVTRMYSSDYRPHWLRMHSLFPKQPTTQWFHSTMVVPIDLVSPHGKKIVDAVLSTREHVRVEVAAAYQLQNLQQELMYQVRRAQMEAEMVEDLEHLSLVQSGQSVTGFDDTYTKTLIAGRIEQCNIFHGTKAQNVQSIIDRGLCIDRALTANASPVNQYGVGIYVATTSRISLDHKFAAPSGVLGKQHQCVFLGDCLTGWSIEGTSSMLRAPPLSRTGYPGANYHSSHGYHKQILNLFHNDQVRLHTLVILKCL